MAFWVAFVVSTPLHGGPILSRQSGNGTGTACASVASIIAAAPAATPTVPADLAYECITSVPLNTTAATDLVNALPPYIDWQSTTAYLKNPPAEYIELIQPANDVRGNLAQIAAKITNGGFANGLISLAPLQWLKRLTLKQSTSLVSLYIVFSKRHTTVTSFMCRMS